MRVATATTAIVVSRWSPFDIVGMCTVPNSHYALVPPDGTTENLPLR
jgi:hypothetical protein